MNEKKELLNEEKGVYRTAFVKILRSWAELTIDEQKAVLTILAIFILGLAVRVWHLQAKPQSPEAGSNRQEIQSHFKPHQERMSGAKYPGKIENTK